MKRVLITTAAAAVLVLTGCAGNGEETTGAEPTAETTAAETTAPETTAPAGGTAAQANEEVRQACQRAVTEKLAGAEFSTRGTLRAASVEGGKTYTVSGTAQAGGTGHPYSCSITVVDGQVTVDEALVDGQ